MTRVSEVMASARVIRVFLSVFLPILPWFFSYLGLSIILFSGTHLANQNYQVCVRQRIDACRICWAPIGVPGTDAIAGSFGVR